MSENFRIRLSWAFRLLFGVTLLAITYFAFTPHAYPALAQYNDKVNHALAFYMLAFLLDFSFPHHKFNLNKILLLIFYGILIEGIQYNLPYRYASIADLGANCLGIGIYWLTLPLFLYVPVLSRRWE